MRSVQVGLLGGFLIGLISLCAVQAQDRAEPGAKSPGADAPKKTFAILRQPFVVRVKLSGVVESTEMHEVRLVPEAWSSWTVEKAVAHGTKVRKGQPIVWFDRRALDQKLEDLAAGRALMELALKQSEEELALLTKSTPIELEKTRRAAKLAAEDLSRFTKIDKPASLRNSAFSLESAKNYLAYQKEELKQLERMYKADDLTDETEEIILRRARDSVKRAEMSVVKTEEKHKQTLAVSLPRQEVEQKESLETSQLALAAAEVDLPLKMSQAKLAVEKLKYDHHKIDVEWKRLKQDADKLIVQAPADGVVYYGRCENGQWSSAAAAEKMLRPGGNVAAHATLMTIVNPEKKIIRCEVPQKDIGAIRPGQQAMATIVGFDESPIVCRVRSVAAIAGVAGKFSCVLDPAKIGKRPQKLAAGFQVGMKCTAEVIVRSIAKALVVPGSAVHTDDQWVGVHYVNVLDSAGQAQKRWVLLGKTQGELSEIRRVLTKLDRPALSGLAPDVPWSGQAGLEEGDQVLLEK